MTDRSERLALERTRALTEAVARLKAREAELRRSHAETISRLARALEFRDEVTGLHVDRMSRYCGLLAERIGLTHKRSEQIGLASKLHDIGKVATPDRVLLKRGPLNVEERALMQAHTKIGHQILAGSGEPLLELAATIALTHHERADGAGYPNALRGTEIPIEGRIAAIADVFDALTSDRPYRPRMPLEQALVLMRSNETAFDAELLRAFFDHFDEVAGLGGLEAAESAPAAGGHALAPTYICRSGRS